MVLVIYHTAISDLRICAAQFHFMDSWTVLKPLKILITFSQRVISLCCPALMVTPAPPSPLLDWRLQIQICCLSSLMQDSLSTIGLHCHFGPDGVGEGWARVQGLKGGRLTNIVLSYISFFSNTFHDSFKHHFDAVPA